MDIRHSHKDDVVLLYAHYSAQNLAKQIAECCHNGREVKVSNDKNTASSSARVPDAASKCVANESSAWQSDASLHKVDKATSVVTSARRVEYRDTIQWKSFADGFPNLFIEDVKYMAGKDVIFIGSFHSPTIIFEQLSVLYAFPRYLAKSFHFILPYFPTGTMERVDTEGQVATAKDLKGYSRKVSLRRPVFGAQPTSVHDRKSIFTINVLLHDNLLYHTLATLLSAIPLSAKGPAQIIIYDIHALQERFYFSDNVIPRLETAVPLLIRQLSALGNSDEIIFAFPDDGAYKRFHLLFPEHDDKLIICAKKRMEGNKRIVTIKDGHPKGKHVVIVDDLVQTGGTLLECGKALLHEGATAVSAYVTHAVFPNQSWRNFVKGDVKFQNFWITNSLPHAEEICQHPPFRLLSLSTIIAENLLGFDLMPS